MKKLLLGIGTIAAVVAPVTTVVACSQDKALKNLLDGQAKEVQDAVRGFVSRYKNHELTQITKGEYVVYDHNRGTPIYFENNNVGTAAVTNFYIQENGNLNLTVNVITGEFAKKGIEIQGSYTDIQVSGNIATPDSLEIQTKYSREHYISSIDKNTDDEWVYFPRNRSQMILSVSGGGWADYLSDKLSDVILDPAKSPQDVLDAINADLAKVKLKVSKNGTDPNFIFNTTGREIESIGVTTI